MFALWPGHLVGSFCCGLSQTTHNRVLHKLPLSHLCYLPPGLIWLNCKASERLGEKLQAAHMGRWGNLYSLSFHNNQTMSPNPGMFTCSVSIKCTQAVTFKPVAHIPFLSLCSICPSLFLLIYSALNAVASLALGCLHLSFCQKRKESYCSSALLTSCIFTLEIHV